jgi:hypothetical protein
MNNLITVEYNSLHPDVTIYTEFSSNLIYKTILSFCFQQTNKRKQTPALYASGAQIPGARSPWRLHLVQWRLLFVGPQYGTCCISPF